MPALRLVRSLRANISVLLDSIMEINLIEARDAIYNILGIDRVHLCASCELFSIRDLADVQTGDF